MASPNQCDPITLEAGQGYRAEIERSNWLTIGAAAEIHKKNRPGFGTGEVVDIKRCRYSTARWTLGTGATREWSFYSEHDEGFEVGHTFPIHRGPNTWEATVVAAEPATGVTIRFTVRYGPHQTRDFFHQTELDTLLDLGGATRIGVES